jgi:hypothetical protein
MEGNQHQGVKEPHPSQAYPGQSDYSRSKIGLIPRGTSLINFSILSPLPLTFNLEDYKYMTKIIQQHPLLSLLLLAGTFLLFKTIFGSSFFLFASDALMGLFLTKPRFMV